MTSEHAPQDSHKQGSEIVGRGKGIPDSYSLMSVDHDSFHTYLMKQSCMTARGLSPAVSSDRPPVVSPG